MLDPIVNGDGDRLELTDVEAIRDYGGLRGQFTFLCRSFVERHYLVNCHRNADKVADNVRLFSGVELWNAVAAEFGISAKRIKADLTLVIERRNKIAHEADLDPSYPKQRWPISREQVEYSCDLLERVARTIFKVAT